MILILDNMVVQIDTVLSWNNNKHVTKSVKEILQKVLIDFEPNINICVIISLLFNQVDSPNQL